MGTHREMLGYVVVMKPWRKHGNGAKGGGRQASTGKKCTLYKLDDRGNRELVASVEGSTAKAVAKELRVANKFIPPHVSINQSGETFF